MHAARPPSKQLFCVTLKCESSFLRPFSDLPISSFVSRFGLLSNFVFNHPNRSSINFEDHTSLKKSQYFELYGSSFSRQRTMLKPCVLEAGCHGTGDSGDELLVPRAKRRYISSYLVEAPDSFFSFYSLCQKYPHPSLHPILSSFPYTAATKQFPWSIILRALRTHSHFLHR